MQSGSRCSGVEQLIERARKARVAAEDLTLREADRLSRDLARPPIDAAA